MWALSGVALGTVGPCVSHSLPGSRVWLLVLVWWAFHRGWGPVHFQGAPTTWGLREQRQ